MKFFAIAVISAFSMTSVRAQDADPADAATLVRAMRADASLREAAIGAVSGHTRDGYYTEAQFECFQKLKASAFTAGLAQLLARELTREEIRQALGFYNSPVGAKYVAFLFVTLDRQPDGSVIAKRVEAEPSMTPGELQSIHDFSKTNVGQKLTTNSVVKNSPEVQAIAKPVIARQLASCGAKYPG